MDINDIVIGETYQYFKEEVVAKELHVRIGRGNGVCDFVEAAYLSPIPNYLWTRVNRTGNECEWIGVQQSLYKGDLGWYRRQVGHPQTIEFIPK